MASYADPTDLVRFGLPAAATEGIDVGDIQAALDAASDLADGYLRARFTLPITAPTNDLKSAVARIAAYELLSTRGYNPETGSDPNVRDRYSDAIAWLKGVAKGDITPALTDSSPAGQLGGPFVLQAQLSTNTTDQNGNPAIVVGRPAARGW